MDLFRGQALGGSEARPAASERFVSLLGATESLRWELGPFWEFGQQLNGEAVRAHRRRHAAPRPARWGPRPA